MNGTQFKVLVVEDDVEAREALRVLLELEGCDAVTAANGREALARLRRAGEPPRLVILDLRMPVMDGWALRAAMLEDATLAEIPVIVLSGEADAATEAKALQAAAYLEKPLDVRRLLPVLDAFRHRASGRRKRNVPAAAPA
jgi:CheY-like chemotaxis protein